METNRSVHRNLIGGQWCEASDVTQNINPSDTRETVGVYARGGTAEAEQAVAAARAAFPAWSCTSPQLRHDILVRAAQEVMSRKNELGHLLSSEEGKTLPEGIGEVTRAANVLAFMAGESLRIPGDRTPGLMAGSDTEVTREPLGVVGVISPWNFPMAIPSVEDRSSTCLWQYCGVQAS